MAWLLKPAVHWAVRHGLGHGVVSRWLEPLFFLEAQKSLVAHGQHPSDSALALASGLHRADVQRYKAQATSLDDEEPVKGISITSQVLANWLHAGLPETIAYRTEGDEPPPDSVHKARTFCDLVHFTSRAATQGFSESLVLKDMRRQGLVTEAQGQVSLHAFSAAPEAHELNRALSQLSQAAHDLLMSGLHNLKNPESGRLLEQSLEVDGLNASSVALLHQQAQKLWQDNLQQLLPQARNLSDHDEPQGGTHRFRLGVYVHTEPLPPATAPPH